MMETNYVFPEGADVQSDAAANDGKAEIIIAAGTYTKPFKVNK